MSDQQDTNLALTNRNASGKLRRFIARFIDVSLLKTGAIEFYKTDIDEAGRGSLSGCRTLTPRKGGSYSTVFFLTSTPKLARKTLGGDVSDLGMFGGAILSRTRR